MGNNIGISVEIDANKCCCSDCIQKLKESLRRIQGVRNIELTGADANQQLKISGKVNKTKFRENRSFYEPQNMTAVLAMQIGCCEAHESRTRRIISRFEGYKEMSIENSPNSEEIKIVKVTGKIAINTLIDKLEKEFERSVNVISVTLQLAGSVVRCEANVARQNLIELGKELSEILSD